MSLWPSTLTSLSLRRVLLHGALCPAAIEEHSSFLFAVGLTSLLLFGFFVCHRWINVFQRYFFVLENIFLRNGIRWKCHSKKISVSRNHVKRYMKGWWLYKILQFSRYYMNLLYFLDNKKLCTSWSCGVSRFRTVIYTSSHEIITSFHDEMFSSADFNMSCVSKLARVVNRRLRAPAASPYLKANFLMFNRIV